MRRRYSISFFIIAMALILSLSYGYYESYERMRYREERKEQASQAVDGSDVEARESKDAPSESGYYLKSEKGYVVVYLFDGETVYEETTIAMDQLEEPLREEIKQVKYIQSTEELYGFLENYSS